MDVGSHKGLPLQGKSVQPNLQYYQTKLDKALEHFWTEQEVKGSKYRNQILADAAELIVVGTNDDDCAFDPKFLPLVEQILLILVEKAESSRIIQEDPCSTFLNSSKGMVFWAMMEYTLRLARIKNTKRMDFRWPQAIRADFNKRLDKSIDLRLNSHLYLVLFCLSYCTLIGNG